MDTLAALRLLSLQAEWGADEALLDSPLDRLAVAPARPVPAPPPVPGPLPAAPSPRAPVPDTLAGCASLDDLRAALSAFTGCALRDTATNIVLPKGPDHPAVLLLGDAPDGDDDRTGRPFAGAAGAYLDRMLASIGLRRVDILVMPLLPWRPPGNRPPSASEIAQCLPFLHRAVALAAPRVLLIAGSLAARTLLGDGARATGWTRATIEGAEAAIPALIVPAPAVLMRTPARRRQAWQALCRLRRALDA